MLHLLENETFLVVLIGLYEEINLLQKMERQFKITYVISPYKCRGGGGGGGGGGGVFL